MEMTLKERLRPLGWGDEMLGESGRNVRIGVRMNGPSAIACFERR